MEESRPTGLSAELKMMCEEFRRVRLPRIDSVTAFRAARRPKGHGKSHGYESHIENHLNANGDAEAVPSFAP
jgi:hypothetical protein